VTIGEAKCRNQASYHTMVRHAYALAYRMFVASQLAAESLNPAREYSLDLSLIPGGQNSNYHVYLQLHMVAVQKRIIGCKQLLRYKRG
jgi:hypothetical protein